ncbi:hypothetical protein [Bradyrhizobium yuanmingense]|uniref:hypothetical protein n=1 Tax=Bradyrhizobium yuanmingense TaxID=108015 RepID=UPI0023B9F675|nr:hypothetical protein [Bradyrhizobium yuanmingense]MDF0582034.1 hypothetical protein [Bradyrhizobium yuanmingense]
MSGDAEARFELPKEVGRFADPQHMRANLPLAALSMAVKKQKSVPTRSVIPIAAPKRLQPVPPAAVGRRLPALDEPQSQPLQQCLGRKLVRRLNIELVHHRQYMQSAMMQSTASSRTSKA